MNTLHPKDKKNLSISPSKTVQLTLTESPYQDLNVSLQTHTPTSIEYNKCKYSSMTNFLQGPKKNKKETITFLGKPVMLSTTRSPCINRKNNKYSTSTPTHTPP